MKCKNLLLTPVLTKQYTGMPLRRNLKMPSVHGPEKMCVNNPIFFSDTTLYKVGHGYLATSNLVL